ncbi:27779_t:CDS:2, partial [Dentiscutata erythropus]
MYNYNFWIDESSFSPNKENKPSVPVIKVPFPPMVNPEELVTRQRKVKSKKVKSQIPTKPPNAFLIYRMQYIKELHNENYHLSMRVISSAIANSWRNEPDNVIEHYENIARQANKIFKQKFPKPPTHQKITVSHSHKKTCEMSKGKIRTFCLALLVIQLFILTFLCPALALAKVFMFDQTNGELNYNKGVEYSYIVLTWSTA